MNDQTLYKVLNEGGTPYHGGSGSWHLPSVGGRPGKWMPTLGRIVPCQRGYHLCGEDHLIRWIGPVVFHAEGRGDVLEHNDGGHKYVYSQARLIRQCKAWTRTAMYLFAADCAEMVLPNFESLFPHDDRPRTAIEVVRRFARGAATEADLSAARSAVGVAESAAWSAAQSAAWSAARSAARSASAEWSAASAEQEMWTQMNARLLAYVRGEVDMQQSAPRTVDAS